MKKNEKSDLREQRMSIIFLVITRLIINLSLSCFTILIPAYMLSQKYSIFQSQYILLGASIITVYWIIKSLGHYRTLVMLSELRIFIKEIKDDVNTLNYHYREDERIIEETKYKIDLLKSFSPIPLVIFILTLVIGEDFSIFRNIKSFKTIASLEIPDLFAVFVAIFITLYVLTIYNSYIYYKKLNRQKYSLLIALEKAKYNEQNPSSLK